MGSVWSHDCALRDGALQRELKFIDWPDHNVDYTQDFVKQPIRGSFTDLSEVRIQIGPYFHPYEKFDQVCD